MKVLSPATFAPFVLGFATVVATFAQCGEGKAGAPAQGAGAPRAAAQDPQGKPVVPKDRLRLLVSGSMHGRLEPCGCASGQLGGLARRVQHIGEQGNYDLLLEGGDLVEHNTPLDPLKLMAATNVLLDMAHYDAIGVGPKDLALPREEWSAFVTREPKQLVASDLECSDPSWPAMPVLQKEVRGIKIRVASLLLAVPESVKAADSPLRHLDAAAAWQRALAGADEATRRIVMVHGDDTSIRNVIPKLQPPPDLVIGIDPGSIEPTAAATRIGNVPLVFAGTRGRVLLDVWLHRDAAGSQAACELVPLPASKTLPGGGGDPNVRDAIRRHRLDVQNDKTLSKMVRQHPTASGASYIGSEMCKNCHPTAYAAYEKMKHFHAWDTLVEAEKDPKRYGWPVTAYPDCVSCHVVGFGEKTGFASLEETPHLAAVGCERCHGPGSDHLQAPEKFKLGMLGGVQPSVLCVQCHDFEQSPTFLYGEKWELIKHAREPNQQKK